MNDLEALKTRQIVAENGKLGIVSLHTWIKWFESLPHLSYRLDIKKLSHVFPVTYSLFDDHLSANNFFEFPGSSGEKTLLLLSFFMWTVLAAPVFSHPYLSYTCVQKGWSAILKKKCVGL
ncbi:hypothetical protein TNCV_3807891 [Trichonephila clavipes]|nr:hypothetical protein TNCV_3807891 [Trichonephila clavipes]